MITINEIFKSISGEAAFAGLPCIFVRTYGCNLRCTYCDTMYAVAGGEFTQMTPEEIVNECNKLGPKHVILTGGEPLIQPDIVELIDLLRQENYTIEIETNGAVDLQKFHNELDLNYPVTYTMDYKSFSSGMANKMVRNNLEFLGKRDVVKFVVGCIEDLEQMDIILDNKDIQAQVFVSPVFGQIEPSEIVQFLLDKGLYNVRVQLQMHKLIWDKNKRGV